MFNTQQERAKLNLSNYKLEIPRNGPTYGYEEKQLGQIPIG